MSGSNDDKATAWAKCNRDKSVTALLLCPSLSTCTFIPVVPEPHPAFKGTLRSRIPVLLPGRWKSEGYKGFPEVWGLRGLRKGLLPIPTALPLPWSEEAVSKSIPLPPERLNKESGMDTSSKEWVRVSNCKQRSTKSPIKVSLREKRMHLLMNL